MPDICSAVKRISLALLAAVSFSTYPALADRAPGTLSGGVTLDILPGQPKTNIAMKSETVTLDVWPDKCVTKASFQLKLEGNKEEKAQVGFPYSGQLGNEDLEGLTVSIDGKSVPVSETVVKTKDQYLQGNDSTNWTVFELTMAPGSARKVAVTYKNKPMVVTTIPENAYCDIGGGDYSDFIEMLKLKQVSYALYSDAYWKGPVGVCDLIITLHQPLTRKNFVSANHEPTSYNAETLSWHLTNILKEAEPKVPDVGNSGISVRFSEYKSEELITMARDFLKKKPGDKVVKRFIKDVETTAHRR